MVNKQNVNEMVMKLAFFIICMIIAAKLFNPIIKPIAMVNMDNDNRQYFYQGLIEKSVPMLEVKMGELEDDPKSNLLTLAFNYITGIDIANPRTYLSSEIPVLGLMDVFTASAHEEAPVVVVPDDTQKPGGIKVSVNTASQTPQITTAPENNLPSVTAPVIPDGPVENPKTVNKAKPIVFIYHTHTTEAYSPNNDKTKYMSMDLNVTVAKAGECLANELETRYGISVVHDTTIHDVPVRNYGYSKSRVTVNSYMKKYPSIRMGIDLHRDSVGRSKSTAVINGVEYARPMFVMSTYKGTEKNRQLAERLNSSLNKLYPGFTRNIMSTKNKYNQDIFTGNILIELGAVNNSLEEAIRTTKILAKVIADELK